ncbi:tetratricopeptide repeat-containing sensor histidine kinase [Spongiivirga citrea]|uniref:histidine kinase n=1 Tax=Spongiivirga citrea TaxID=1481457 RepID=A0A6M0CHM3_9FLAO|nr:hypothetical protein [Spongiivirga citrea]NER17012.1 hypothetical protein [Spongiivirga citrea]
MIIRRLSLSNIKYFLFLFISYCISCDSSERKVNVTDFNSVPEILEDKRKSSEEKLTFINHELEKRKLQKDSFTLYLLSKKIFHQNKLKMHRNSVLTCDTMISIANETKNIKYLAEAFYRKGSTYRVLNNNLEAYLNFQESTKNYQKLSDNQRAGKRFVDMAILQEKLGDYLGSESSAVNALNYLDLVVNKKYGYKAYNAIAISQKKRTLFDDAIKSYKQALSTSSNRIDSARVLINMANTYSAKKDYQASIQILTSVETPINNAKIKARLIDNLAFTQWRFNPTYNPTDEYKKALEIRENNNLTYDLQASYSHLSDYYRTKDTAKAIDFSERYLRTAKQQNSTEDVLLALQKLIALSNPTVSKNYGVEYVRLSDSLNKVKEVAKNQFAKVKYEVDKKENENQLLITENLKKEKTILFYLALLLSLIFGAAFLFLYLKSKHRKEKLLAAYITETRISKKVHDEIANDMFNVMTQLENEQTNPKVIDELEDIYHRTRDISKENTNIHIGEHYGKNLTSMIGSYGQSGVKIILKGIDTIQWKQLSNEKKVILYRVLQEFMTNMRKHSNAKWVTLSFTKSSKKLTVLYADQGVGISNGKLILGNGLQNVENRILSVNGTLTFDTENENGFNAHIQIPY